MTKTEMQQVLYALKINRVMSEDEEGDYTREITPKVITAAIAIMQSAVDAPTSGDYALGYAKGFNAACKPLDITNRERLLASELRYITSITNGQTRRVAEQAVSKAARSIAADTKDTP